jgi:Flp pilus assembly protein protease CpaA
MPVAPDLMKLLLLIPMAVFIMYYDVRYRRIPNVLVLSLLIGGLTIKISFVRWRVSRDSRSLSCPCF